MATTKKEEDTLSRKTGPIFKNQFLRVMGKSHRDHSGRGSDIARMASLSLYVGSEGSSGISSPTIDLK